MHPTGHATARHHGTAALRIRFRPVRRSKSAQTKQSSAHMLEGRTYQGEIATEVVDADKKVLLPRGAQVELVMLEAKEKSGVKGASSPTRMRSVTVRRANLPGRQRRSEADEWARQEQEDRGNRRRRRRIRNVNRSGGGRRQRRVIGGLVGAAAGAAVQVLTQGKEVRIPAESVLRFQLDEPIHLQTR